MQSEMEKKLYKIDWRGQYQKTFCGLNKFCSVVSYCLCYCQVHFTGLDKQTNFLCYGIHYSRKKFYDTGPGCVDTIIKPLFAIYVLAK